MARNRYPRQKVFLKSAVEALDGLLCVELYADGEDCISCGVTEGPHKKDCLSEAARTFVRHLFKKAENAE
jgi:hypothetical protein